MRGKPIRFLATVVFGWTGIRAFVLWPVATVLLPKLAADAVVPSAAAAVAPLVGHGGMAVRPPGHLSSAIQPAFAAMPRQPDANGVILALFGMNRYHELPYEEPGAPPAPTTPLVPGAIGMPFHPIAPGSRWSSSSWLIARSAGPTSLVSPLLGGAQAGTRVAYAIDAGRRLSVFGRASSPLASGPRELALGADWRPTRLPIHVFAEGRAATGLPVAPVAGIFGGVSELPTAAGFKLDGYGAAGVIVRDGTSGFGEGQLRLSHAVAAAGGIKLDLGVGSWGAAQRGATRLDVGPSIGVRLPLGDRALRVTVDWRQRIAGNARPLSGPALSLGTDF